MTGAQIDVQTLDMEGVPVQPDQAFLADRMASSDHSSSQRVVANQVTFAGGLWEHRETSKEGRRALDMFVLVRDRVMYAILISQPKRDQRLIEAAKKGFRIIPKSTLGQQSHTSVVAPHD